MKHQLLVIFSIVLLQPVVAKTDFEIVKERVVKNLERPVNEEQVEQLILTLKADGSWPGINYVDVSRTAFEHVKHLSALVTLSRAYHFEGTQYYQSDIVAESVNHALAYWCDNDFICDNWWHNQINTPRQLVQVLLLMDDVIKPELKDAALKITSRGNLNASGARPSGDRIKIAGIAAKRLLAMGDEELFAEIVEEISNEMKFNTGSRGMQHDYSFHHRPDRVNNTLSYGSGFATTFAEWSYYLRNTKYSIAQEKVEQLVNYFLDGMVKQCIYGIYEDWNVKNRAVSRMSPFHPRSSFMAKQLLEVTGYRSDELQEVILLREGKVAPSASFAKFFWQTEHFVFQRPDFFTSVRMFSTRNRNMEKPYNSEGLKNHHKADGSSFLSVRGDEYDGIWPVYDWQKIPGSTILQKRALPDPPEIQKEGLTNFVGAVTDGMYGAVAFDFVSPHNLVKAHKSWFFFDNAYVCMGASIEGPSGAPVATSVNQCLLNGNVAVKDGDGERILEKGVHALDDVQWVHHDNVGYWFPGSTDLYVSDTMQSGSWYDINKQWDTPRDRLEMGVFKAWIDHGERPQGSGVGVLLHEELPKDAVYQYIVTPSVSVADMAKDPGIEILANDQRLHAVRNRDDGMVQAVFYSSDTLALTGEVNLIADSPAAIIVKMDGDRITSLSVADPSRLLGKVHFSITGAEHEIYSLAKDPSKTKAVAITYDNETGVTHLAISLRKKYYAGSSCTVFFN